MSGRHPCLEFPVDRASVRFHPIEGYGHEALKAVGGPYLDDITALPVPVQAFSSYIPQIRMRRNRHELPLRPAYGIRLDQVLRRNVHTAAGVRAFCGVPDSARLILFCYATDSVLETFWDDVPRARAIASGGWDLIIAPSFSLWYQRPRPLHFHAIKRSYNAFQALQSLGAAAAPRAEFIDRRDVEVQANWFNAHPTVEMLSFDWMTCRADRDWIEGAELLALFDGQTARRLHYLINGTTVFPRIGHLARLIGENRLMLTDATVAKPPRRAPRHARDLPVDLRPNAAFNRLVTWREGEIRAAITAARRGSYEIDATADEAAELGRKGRQAARRGRKPRAT